MSEENSVREQRKNAHEIAVYKLWPLNMLLLLLLLWFLPIVWALVEFINGNIDAGLAGLGLSILFSILLFMPYIKSPKVVFYNFGILEKRWFKRNSKWILWSNVSLFELEWSRKGAFGEGSYVIHIHSNTSEKIIIETSLHYNQNALKDKFLSACPNSDIINKINIFFANSKNGRRIK